ncbi:hypothetical protein CRV24_000425 [Beauveria bassiana]|nr:hypothetical protein CRV24_000425 [Beauveria bassiana]KAH8721034.1 hypothetical protein HC256_001407 [Beauveria bassiana]
MPDIKRSFSSGESSHEDELEKKSRTSILHLENRERAYIAASRRTDRSLEARYQSALMASEVHKKRTGKSLRITHKIVKNEGMYEEEEQGLPHSWRLPSHRTKQRAMSQTDAYIAALIARKSGMDNSFQTNNASFSTRFPNHMNDGGNANWIFQSTYTPPAADDYPVGHLQPVSDGKAELSFTTPVCFPLSKLEDTLYPTAEYRSSVDSSCLESPTFPTASFQTQPRSHVSYSSDLSTEDSNYAIDFNSESGKQSSEVSSLHLEECLVDMDSDSSLNFTQNGMLVGYS